MPTKTGKLTKVLISAENWDNTTTFGKGLLCLYMDELPHPQVQNNIDVSL